MGRRNLIGGILCDLARVSRTIGKAEQRMPSCDGNEELDPAAPQALRTAYEQAVNSHGNSTS